MISLLFIHEMGYGLGIAKKRKRKGYNSSSLRHLQTMVDLVGLATDAVFAFANRPLVANLFSFEGISYCDYIKAITEYGCLGTPLELRRQTQNKFISPIFIPY